MGKRYNKFSLCRRVYRQGCGIEASRGPQTRQSRQLPSHLDTFDVYNLVQTLRQKGSRKIYVNQKRRVGRIRRELFLRNGRLQQFRPFFFVPIMLLLHRHFDFLILIHQKSQNPLTLIEFMVKYPQRNNWCECLFRRRCPLWQN